MSPPSDARARFDRDGFLIMDRILDAEQVHRMSQAMDRVYRGDYDADRRPPRIQKPLAPFGDASSVRWVLNARVVDSDVWALATDARLGEIAATLLGTRSVSIVEDQLLDKPPGGVPVSMHQDYAYWPFSSATRMITAWIALVDMTLDLGPVEVIPGSHTWGTGRAPEELIRGSEQDWLRAADASRPAGASADRVAAVVPAGGGVFLHCLTFHGSGANASDRNRRAMSLHWAAEECRVKLSGTRAMSYPYFFARLEDGGRIDNNYMPVVYTSLAT